MMVSAVPMANTNPARKKRGINFAFLRVTVLFFATPKAYAPLASAIFLF
jgi:hypothetical protein